MELSDTITGTYVVEYCKLLMNGQVVKSDIFDISIRNANRDHIDIIRDAHKWFIWPANAFKPSIEVNFKNCSVGEFLWRVVPKLK